MNDQAYMNTKIPEGSAHLSLFGVECIVPSSMALNEAVAAGNIFRLAKRDDGVVTIETIPGDFAALVDDVNRLKIALTERLKELGIDESQKIFRGSDKCQPTLTSLSK